MGISVSVDKMKRLEAMKSNIQTACNSLPSKEEHARLERLRIDLVLYKEVREAFVEFVVWRENASEDAVATILNIDESYMDYLLLQGSVDDPRDEVTDLILSNLRMFANSSAYESVFAKEDNARTPITCFSEDNVYSTKSSRTRL